MKLPVAGLLGLALFVCPARPQAINFLARTDIPAYTVAIGVGDLRGNGNSDIVWASYLPVNPAEVCTSLGGAEGAFTPGPCTPLVASGFARSLIVGDFNGDGLADVVVSTDSNGNNNTAAMYVLFGTGSGTFTGQTEIASLGTSNTYQILVADLNGDGIRDIVALIFNSTGQPTLQVFPGLPGGQFGLPMTIAEPQQYQISYTIAVGDLDGDGKPDLVMGADNGLLIFLNHGDFTFAQQPYFSVSGEPTGVAIGDLNSDGKADLVFDSQNSTGIQIALGSGAGAFAKPYGIKTPAGTRPGSISIVDLNGDGVPDLVTSGDTDTVALLLGEGAGKFKLSQSFTVGLGPGPTFPFVPVGSKLPDLISPGVGVISVLKNLGNGTFFDGIAYNAGDSIQTVTADFNGDGFADLAVFSPTGIQVLFGTGKLGVPFRTGPFTSSTTLQTDGYFAAGDFNGDGRPDLALSLEGPGGTNPGVAVLPGNGDGTFGTPVVTALTVPPRQMETADFNGDGILDIVGSTMTLLFGKAGGTFTQSTALAVGFPSVSVSIADFNHDGKPDLVFCVGGYAFEIVSYLNLGGGAFSPPIELNQFTQAPERCAVGDFNGDGIPDLVYAQGGSGFNVGFFPGKRNGTFGSPTVMTYPFWLGTNNIAVADFNHDGKLDFAVSIGDSNTVAIMQGNGDGTFTLAGEFGVNSGADPTWLTLGKFHTGGVGPDIAVSSNVNGLTAILMNTSK